MADITVSWPRLTCPALALRQAAPWRWKTSATSSLGRLTPPGYAPGLGVPSGSGASRSSGLVTLRIVLLATRV
jgi:hypothetical protein